MLCRQLLSIQQQIQFESSLPLKTFVSQQNIAHLQYSQMQLISQSQSLLTTQEQCILYRYFYQLRLLQLLSQQQSQWMSLPQLPPLPLFPSSSSSSSSTTSGSFVPSLSSLSTFPLLSSLTSLPTLQSQQPLQSKPQSQSQSHSQLQSQSQFQSQMQAHSQSQPTLLSMPTQSMTGIVNPLFPTWTPLQPTFYNTNANANANANINMLNVSNANAFGTSPSQFLSADMNPYTTRVPSPSVVFEKAGISTVVPSKDQPQSQSQSQSQLHGRESKHRAEDEAPVTTTTTTTTTTAIATATEEEEEEEEEEGDDEEEDEEEEEEKEAKKNATMKGIENTATNVTLTSGVTRANATKKKKKKKSVNRLFGLPNMITVNKVWSQCIGKSTDDGIKLRSALPTAAVAATTTKVATLKKKQTALTDSLPETWTESPIFLLTEMYDKLEMFQISKRPGAKKRGARRGKAQDTEDEDEDMDDDDDDDDNDNDNDNDDNDDEEDIDNDNDEDEDDDDEEDKEKKKKGKRAIEDKNPIAAVMTPLVLCVVTKTRIWTNVCSSTA
ncbi:zinc finger DNA-binding transcription factor [Reticulomyxa filosa]|uniref:Zinc finger DNA-binding transcription factor n=1 Tax=Reticulomyxa filosa TaxID=46433 RepID=X6N4R1_RETFI|nr:zinc finger DNA-binding transcription factor [Reticulomyxa filosa]|eukprot:ETO21011.1 zinc finger DNA-binding transcription factor [Reticulomyxa filosa]